MVLKVVNIKLILINQEQNIMKQSSTSNSEATTASIFEREIYYLLRARTGKELEFIKEEKIDGVEHKFGKS